ncbi:hypothetical protein AK830_g2770 [Neonectria ditissima]|uniref:Xylanolytic transcriptional activator regulatory domain-containing protein n=1 Tax=Neonectria ditissima TaxID=78410 RepID=A0A0P7BJ81_9HYPO|nr:hypothetical protein AK830_g2770 [Neonectria ditissima]
MLERDAGSDRQLLVAHVTTVELGSLVTSTATTKQRVLVSAQYEEKLDDIAKGIDSIKHLLAERNKPSQGQETEVGLVQQLTAQGVSAKPSTTHQPIIFTSNNHSSQDRFAGIIEFVKCVVGFPDPGNLSSGMASVIPSLKTLLEALKRSNDCQSLAFAKTKTTINETSTPRMPSLENAIAVLRWVDAYKEHPRVAWISHILPFHKFADICTKVYFALEDYSQIDFILANGYLSYIFAAHIAISGAQTSLSDCDLCRDNVHTSLSRLPLILPASMDVVAALIIGTLSALEYSDVSTAWTLIINASNICQTLKYHRLKSDTGSDEAERLGEKHLFWTLYRIEKALSLRLGRPSTICDADITLPFIKDARLATLERLQSSVAERLDNPTSTPGDLACHQAHVVRDLSEELRAMTKGTHHDAMSAGSDMSPIQSLYLQCELVYESSILASILRIISTSIGSPDAIPDDCITVARDILDTYHQCNTSCRARLESFADSTKPIEEESSGSTTCPHQLYQLLCQAAQLYTQAKAGPSISDQTGANTLPRLSGEFNFAALEPNLGGASQEAFQGVDPCTYSIDDCHAGAEQLMAWLDGDDAMLPASALPM